MQPSENNEPRNNGPSYKRKVAELHEQMLAAGPNPSIEQLDMFFALVTTLKAHGARLRRQMDGTLGLVIKSIILSLQVQGVRDDTDLEKFRDVFVPSR